MRRPRADRARRRRRRASFALPVLLTACETMLNDPTFRVGAAAGTAWSDPTVDRERPLDLDPAIDPAWGGAGFVELVADDMLHFRAVGHREHHRVPGTATTAELTEALGFVLFAPRVEAAGSIAAKPFVGLGFGYGEIDTDPILDLGARKGVAFAVALGAEIEVARHAFAGVMTWLSVFGEPGNTDGDSSTVMFYAGVRF